MACNEGCLQGRGPSRDLVVGRGLEAAPDGVTDAFWHLLHGRGWGNKDS